MNSISVRITEKKTGKLCHVCVDWSYFICWHLFLEALVLSLVNKTPEHSLLGNVLCVGVQSINFIKFCLCQSIFPSKEILWRKLRKIRILCISNVSNEGIVLLLLSMFYLMFYKPM